MGLNIGVYAPGLDQDSLTAPQTCLVRLIDALERTDMVDCTIITHTNSSTASCVDSTHVVPRMPLRCERAINAAGFDVVHFNTFVDPISPRLLTMPTVLTCHGDVYREYPSLVDGSSLKPYVLRALERYKIPQYDRVLCVSADLEQRVVSRHAETQQTATVHNGIDHDRFHQDGGGLPDRYGITSPYLLHVSNFSEKKNSRGVLGAYRHVQQRTDIPLVVCGGRWQDNEAINERIREWGLEDEIHLVGHVPTDDLAAFYRNATVVIYPSLHETFGLPILEAMACGTAVVTSNIYAMPEIAGDAAITCDPRDTEAIADAITVLLEEPSIRAEYERNGVDRAQQFTWERAAEQVIQTYHSIVE